MVAAGYVILAGTIYLFVRHVDGHRLLRVLARTHPAGLVVACLLTLVQLVCRASVFRTLILPLVWIPWLRVQRFMLASSAATALVPGRAGEFIRAYLLKRDQNVAVAATAAVTAVEKSIEVLGLFLILVPLPLLLPHLPGWVGKSILVAAIVVATLLLAALWLAKHEHLPRWLAPFTAGLEIVHRPSLLARALTVSVGSWLIDLGCLLAVMHAVGVSAPPASALLVLLAVNVAIAVPLVPGNLGTVELGAVAGFQPFGVSYDQGLAVGLLYHLAQVLPIALLAFLDSRFVVEKSLSSPPHGHG